jgi:hypothetical protein|tara:strand:- start:788 stop:1774 length:987 start_codon:yes stop_codon:yes gene_type:complete
MFEYFYHEILRKTIISFGTLFNNITIQKKDASDTDFSVMKIPLAYGPTQKFLARLDQNLNKSTAISLPRMSFEFTGLTYDSSRKVTTTQKIAVKDPDTKKKVDKVFTPVPYNMQFELSIMSKLNDDALQIVEQILPYFQPAFNLSVELVQTIKEKRDIPIVLENITMQDDYEGDYSTRRVLLYTLRFTAKTYLFGPVTRVEPIKQATLSYYTDNAEKRDLAYRVTPRAVKDYDDSVVTNLSDDILSSATTIVVDDASSIVADTYFEIDGESIYIKKVGSGNKLTIDRARDNTIAKDHVKGSALKSITQADTDLIEFGDDFGFDGETFS